METIYADRFVLGERFETDNHTPYLNQDLMTQIDRSDGSSCADGLGQLALEQVDYTLADQVLLAAVLLLGALRLAAVFRAAICAAPLLMQPPCPALTGGAGAGRALHGARRPRFAQLLQRLLPLLLALSLLLLPQATLFAPQPDEAPAVVGFEITEPPFAALAPAAVSRWREPRDPTASDAPADLLPLNGAQPQQAELSPHAAHFQLAAARPERSAVPGSAVYSSPSRPTSRYAARRTADGPLPTAGATATGSETLSVGAHALEVVEDGFICSYPPFTMIKLLRESADDLTVSGAAARSSSCATLCPSGDCGCSTRSSSRAAPSSAPLPGWNAETRSAIPLMLTPRTSSATAASASTASAAAETSSADTCGSSAAAAFPTPIGAALALGGTLLALGPPPPSHDGASPLPAEEEDAVPCPTTPAPRAALGLAASRRAGVDGGRAERDDLAARLQSPGEDETWSAAAALGAAATAWPPLPYGASLSPRDPPQDCTLLHATSRLTETSAVPTPLHGVVADLALPMADKATGPGEQARQIWPGLERALLLAARCGRFRTRSLFPGSDATQRSIRERRDYRCARTNVRANDVALKMP